MESVIAMGNSISGEGLVQMRGQPKFVEFKDLDKTYKENCPCSVKCQLEDHEIDLFHCRLRFSRCKEHGELYGKSVVQLWR